MRDNPLVSIGLPVYNGQDFVAEAVQSIQSQTFPDWELVISDNASTDRTFHICAELAREDNRIRLYRNERNLGIAPNYNRVFELSRGRYFKWIAHDDYCGPEFLQSCVRVLEGDGDIALAFSRVVHVDVNRRPLRTDAAELSNLGRTAARRVDLLTHMEAESIGVLWSQFGLIRRSVLEETRLMGGFNASDQVLLLEVALRGKLIQIDKDLMFRREHPAASSMTMSRNAKERARWNHADDRRTFVLPYWRLWKEHIVSIRNCPMSLVEKIRCVSYITRRFAYHWKDMVSEVIDIVYEASSSAVSKSDGGSSADRA